MIAEMRHLTVAVLKSEKAKLLSALQKYGKVMIVGGESDETPSGEKLRQYEQLLEGLKPYTQKKKMFEDAPEMSESDFERFSESEKLKQIGLILSEISEGESRLASLKAQHAALLPWVNLPEQGEFKSKYTDILFYIVPRASYQKFTEHMERAAFETVSESESSLYVTVVCEKGEVPSLPEGCAEKISPPRFEGNHAQQLDILQNKIHALDSSIEYAKNSLKDFSKSGNAAQVEYEKALAKYQRDAVSVTHTEMTVFVNGWTAKENQQELEEVIKNSVSAYALDFRAPLEDEEVPTLEKNNKFVSPFEGITQMFSPPSYGQPDPNPVMAPWYWIIFGIMMGDVGYGAMMLLGCLAFIKFLKPKEGTLKLVKVIMYSSIPTIFFGVFFGSYFGAEWYPPLCGFTLMGEPIKMLIFTLIIGVLHIFTGMIAKMAYLIKDGRWLDAIFDQFSWIMIILGLGMIFLPALKNIGIYLAIAGAAIVLFTAGRDKKNIFGKISGGLVSLYGATSYLSDILSYSRILALALSTSVIALVMNMLAGMVSGGVIGFIASVLIYIVGHLFNLVLSLLSAYVHDSRLQYIEFYGKFYDGGGKMFVPFKVRTKYISLKKSGGKNDGR